jgi:hypothetical protein
MGIVCFRCPGYISDVEGGPSVTNALEMEDSKISKPVHVVIQETGEEIHVLCPNLADETCTALIGHKVPKGRFQINDPKEPVEQIKCPYTK